jgi:hypothetical protein
MLGSHNEMIKWLIQRDTEYLDGNPECDRGVQMLRRCFAQIERSSTTRSAEALALPCSILTSLVLILIGRDKEFDGCRVATETLHLQLLQSLSDRFHERHAEPTVEHYQSRGVPEWIRMISSLPALIS